MVLNGLDIAIGWLRGERVPAEDRETAALLKGGRLGLVTNPSAVTTQLLPAPEALTAAGAKLRALFGPEHGVRGDALDGAPVADSKDSRTGIPAYSLYGKISAPTPEMLAGLDAVLFDVQDVGARFYTFISTLSHVMTACGQANIPVIVLDRPNPLGGIAVEGPLLEPEHASFVGMHPIPIRHAATLGELGRLWSEFGAGPEPRVVRCHGWRRRHRWESTGLQWPTPSPAMPSALTALVYPGTCLIEGTNLSEGRGTSAPFRWFGAPWLDAEALAERLNREGLPGAGFRPIRFSPTSSKHLGVLCAGCEVHVLDPAAFQPVATGVAILAAARASAPDQFQWRQSGTKYSVDRLAGTSLIREQITAGRAWRQIAEPWREQEERHESRLRGIRLYE